MHTPLSFTFTPFSEKPSFGSNATLRMPKGVVYVSTTEPFTETFVTAEYIVGEVGDQSFGPTTVIVCATSPLVPAPIGVAGAASRAISVPESSRMALVTETCWADEVSFWTETVNFTVALAGETCGVVTCVPV